jgi:hypothetical protein
MKENSANFTVGMQKYGDNSATLSTLLNLLRK